MFSNIRQYGRNFRHYNRNNDFGWTLAIVAVAFLLVWGVLAIGASMMGMVLTVGWWAVLPVLFTVLSVAHLCVRPVVSARYAGNK